MRETWKPIFKQITNPFRSGVFLCQIDTLTDKRMVKMCFSLRIQKTQEKTYTEVGKSTSLKWPFLFKACKIEVGLRNNFRLAGWDLGSPCVQAYHVILLNSRSLYPEFENELRKSACLSSFSKRWEGFVICLSSQLNYLQKIK